GGPLPGRLGPGPPAAASPGGLLPFRRDLSTQPVRVAAAGGLEEGRRNGRDSAAESPAARAGLGGGHPAPAQRRQGGCATVAQSARRGALSVVPNDDTTRIPDHEHLSRSRIVAFSAGAGPRRRRRAASTHTAL